MYQAGASRPLGGMSSPNPRAVVGAVGTLAVAVITVLTVFKVVHWSAAQTALVTAEVAAVAGLLTAVVAHFRPATPQEHVALAATFTAAVTATLALGSGFAWWHLTQEEISAAAGVVTAVFGVGGAFIARQHVTARPTPT